MSRLRASFLRYAPCSIASAATLLQYKDSKSGVVRILKPKKLFGYTISKLKFMVLYQGCVYIYKDERSKKPSKSYSLYSFKTVCRTEGFQDTLWILKLSLVLPEISKPKFYAALTSDDLESWIEKFKVEIEFANNTGTKNELMNVPKEHIYSNNGNTSQRYSGADIGSSSVAVSMPPRRLVSHHKYIQTNVNQLEFINTHPVKDDLYLNVTSTQSDESEHERAPSSENSNSTAYACVEAIIPTEHACSSGNEEKDDDLVHMYAGFGIEDKCKQPSPCNGSYTNVDNMTHGNRAFNKMYDCVYPKMEQTGKVNELPTEASGYTLTKRNLTTCKIDDNDSSESEGGDKWMPSYE